MFRPILNAVVIRPENPEHFREGSILLPQGAEPRSHVRRGKVISVGAGHKTRRGQIALAVSPGDEVLYKPSLLLHSDNQYRPYDRFPLDGEEVDIIAEEHVLAVIE